MYPSIASFEIILSMAPSSQSDRSLLTLILDVSPTTWGERDLKRTAQDRSRFAASKRSVGPARLDDMLTSTIAFCLSFAALRRDNAVVVVGVADDEVAILYPRKGGSGRSNMGSVVHDPPDTVGGKVDARALNESVRLGVAELVERASAKAAQRAEVVETQSTATEAAGAAAGPPNGAAIASALTVALCAINRFMVAAGVGVSALAPSDRPGGMTGAASSAGTSDGDGGVMALITGGSKTKSKVKGQRGAPSPRILVVQATDDRAGDYNAFMNCTFAAHKGNVVIDGCFIPSGISGRAKNSAYLEQASDRTGGVFLAPSGAAQVGGALTEVLVSVFLSPVAVRKRMNLPSLSEVDFRPRCFETGETVDTAFVCNQCLSIFKNCPRDSCPTCGADVAKKKKPSSPLKKSKKARHA